MSEAKYRRLCWWHFGLTLVQACTLSVAIGGSIGDPRMSLALKAYCVAFGLLGVATAAWFMVRSVRNGLVLAAQRGALEALQEASELRRQRLVDALLAQAADEPS